jgi:DNA-binding protein HU-beta
MSKANLVEDIAKRTGGSKADAERHLDATFRAIEQAVKGGGDVRIPSFGTFKMKHRPERMARNPATGEQIKVAARDEIGFKPARER